MLLHSLSRSAQEIAAQGAPTVVVAADGPYREATTMPTKKKFGRWEIEETIGEGGQAHVFLVKIANKCARDAMY